MTPHDPIEHELSEVAPDVRRALADMVRGVEAGPEMRARVERGLRSAPTRRAGLPLRRVLAAAAMVAVLAGGVAVLGGLGDDPDEVVTVADDPEGGDDRSVTEASPLPTVGGVVITRPEGDGTATTVPTTVPTGTETTAPVASASPATGPDSSPATTALVCRDSFDPACGEFRWDPEPVVGQSTLQMHLPSAAPRVGVPYEVVLELTDPTAPPTFNCGTFIVDPPPGGSTVGEFPCQIEPPPPCPARYGPWTPPEPNGGTTTHTVTITFDQPGNHSLSASTRPASGCYQPYGSTAYTSVTVEVLP